MFRIVWSPTFTRQLLTRTVTTSRSLFMAVDTAKAPLTSLNKAAAQVDLNLDGTLEEIAARHFSEASTFPEFSPMEDALLSETVRRIKTPAHIMDAHARAAEELTLGMQQHFCEPSDFPENTVAEEAAMLQTYM